jgi:hypothetical protein
MGMLKACGLAAVLSFYGQVWAAPIGGGEPTEPPDHSGPIIPSPTNLIVRTRSESLVTIDFNCGGNADVHEGWRRLGTTGTFTRTSTASGCSFKDTSVLPETNYCYRVKALNDTHVAWSPIVCLTTLAPTTNPRAPTVYLDALWQTSIQVVYRDNSTNENYFRIYRRRVGDIKWSIVQTITRPGGAHRGVGGQDQGFMDTGLLPETAYEYVVRAGYDPIDPAQLPRYSNSLTMVASTRGPNSTADLGCMSATEFDCDSTFTLSNGTALTYYANHGISTPNPDIKRLVIVVHGVERNPWAFLGAMAAAANSQGVLGETLIVAPEFKESQWGNWVQGDQSYITWPSYWTISSYAAVDELVQHVANPARFPSLQEVVISGHSGGGQFTQRYAATSRSEDDHPTLKFRYVVANPNSYMYLNQWRPSATTAGSFFIPGNCPGYNDYKFGLGNRNTYALQVTEAEILSEYPRREVIYLLGANDTDMTDENLHQECEYSLQGPERLTRGRNLYGHMLKYFPDNAHRLLVVPNVGHNRSGMFSSLEGALALFF